MPITYKEIAEIVGVSRGTVDRALNNRGRIDPDVKRKIEQVAEQHGFSPSHIGRALARAKNPVKIGVVVHLSKIPFFQQVISGINQAKTEITNLGGELLIEEIPFLDAEAQLKTVEALVEEGIQGLAISPAHDAALKARLNEFVEDKNLPIITFNTDMEGLKRMCYVGLNNIQAGRTAAGLMGLLLKEKGGKVLIISGHRSNPANSQRADGFVQEIERKFPLINIISCQYNRDEEEEAYNIVLASLKEIPDLAAIYMLSSGQAGACRALEAAEKNGIIKMIVFDTLLDTKKYIQKGVIDFIIDQNAFVQGNRPPHLLYDYLFNKKPIERENIFTDIRINTMYNV